MTEEELLIQIKEAEAEQREAQKKYQQLKKDLMSAETRTINANLLMARLREALRVCRNTTVRKDPSARQIEIDEFRAKHPDLVELAKKRDAERP